MGTGKVGNNTSGLTFQDFCSKLLYEPSMRLAFLKLFFSNDRQALCLLFNILVRNQVHNLLIY